MKIALDLDSLESGENRATAPFAILRGRSGSYDPVILEGFAKLRGDSQDVRMVELQIRELTIGMIFGEDLKSPSDVLLVARGQEVTAGVTPTSAQFPCGCCQSSTGAHDFATGRSRSCIGGRFSLI